MSIVYFIGRVPIRSRCLCLGWVARAHGVGLLLQSHGKKMLLVIRLFEIPVRIFAPSLTHKKDIFQHKLVMIFEL